MKKHKLNHPYNFCIEVIENKKLRFIILDQEEEYVCRMEKRAEIEKFLLEKEGQLFKGRLQLEMANVQIHIIAKGKQVGSITKHWLENALEDLDLVK